MADWSTIEALPQTRIERLFADDPERLSKLSLDVAGIHFDWSKTHLTKDAVAGRIRRLLSMADRKAAELGIPDTESVVTEDMLDDA